MSKDTFDYLVGYMIFVLGLAGASAALLYNRPNLFIWLMLGTPLIFGTWMIGSAIWRSKAR